jgi:hypothetical protein
LSALNEKVSKIIERKNCEEKNDFSKRKKLKMKKKSENEFTLPAKKAVRNLN